MAGKMLFSCPDHTSLREATSAIFGEWKDGEPPPVRPVDIWQDVKPADYPLTCDLCESDVRHFGAGDVARAERASGHQRGRGRRSEQWIPPCGVTPRHTPGGNRARCR